jgi:hypothetical protein
MTSSNGHDPMTSVAERYAELAHATDEFFDSVTGGFAAQIEREEAMQAELASMLDDSRDRSKRMRKALDSLTAPSPTTKSVATTTKKKAAPAGGDWAVSDDKVDMILGVIRGLGDGEKFTAAVISKQMPGTSPETARKAINVLREREVIRFVGKGRGGGKLFSLMPEHTAAGAQLEVVA